MTDGFDVVRAALADRYDVQRVIGRGGAATVYLAHDRKHDRAVAVKVLHAPLAATIGAEQFLREIKLVAGLQHPHILPLYDSGEAQGVLFYVMPYVAGDSLRARLHRERQLPLADALRIVREVAGALEYAHSLGIVHCDVKPENILLSQGHALVADFGVARAIAAAADHAPDPASVAGTIAYMSPEQAAGSPHLDGRSDVYSLGCVLYELLTGRPPYDGRDERHDALRGLVRRPPRVSGIREHIPPELELVLDTALARLPADRFRTARELADELALLPIRRSSGEVLPRPRLPWTWAGLGVVAAVAGFVLATRPPLFAGGRADPMLVAVVPFQQRAAAGAPDASRATATAPGGLDGHESGLLLYDAFSRWRDVRLVDELRMRDALARRGDHLELGDDIALAKAFGAGRLVTGEVWQLRDTVFVRAALYDVAHPGRVLRQHTVRIGADLRDVSERFDELADSLLLGHLPPGPAGSGAMGTHSLAAWEAYQRGHRALARWQLDSAREAFRDAVALDPSYAHAHLWLAEVLLWSDAVESPEWRQAAATAVTLDAHLSPAERQLARAELAMADGQFGRACSLYRGLLERDSLSFSAWYGYGECHRRDDAVVRDPASASGWRFRASYEQALQGYRHALLLVPSAQAVFRGAALARLSTMFFAQTNHLRRGEALAPDTGRFLAYPALDHDTLVFVPRPWSEVAAGRPVASLASVSAAAGRGQRMLYEVARAWATAFPRSADASEALAIAMESAGDTGSAGAPTLRAVVRNARAQATEPAQRARLAGAETRVLLKLGDFAAARRLADSLLARAPAGAPPAAALQLAGIAALTGHAHRAAELLRRAAPADTIYTADGRPVLPPAPMRDAARSMLAYAALGAPRDSVVALEHRVDRLARSWLPPAEQARARDDALALPLSLAVPIIGPAPVLRLHGTQSARVRMQMALARGDTAGVRARLAELRRTRRPLRAGDLLVHGTYQDAWLLVTLGDTAEAMETLDLALDALPTLGTGLLEVTQAAGLVRAMALRAELAERRGDADRARRWASAVVTLWGDADPPLQPLVARMRRIAAPVPR